MDEMGKRPARRAKSGRKAPAPEPTIADALARVGSDLNKLTVSELRSVQRFQALQREIRASIAAALGDKYGYSRSELAEVCGVHERTITRWSKQGRLPQSHDRKWDIRDVLRQYLSLEDTHQGQTAAERYDLARARQKELALAQQAGELMDRDVILRAVAPLVSALRSRLIGHAERILQRVPVSQRPGLRTELESETAAFLKDLQEEFKHAAQATS